MFPNTFALRTSKWGWYRWNLVPCTYDACTMALPFQFLSTHSNALKYFPTQISCTMLTAVVSEVERGDKILGAFKVSFQV